jgi:hypothetical protein
MQNELPPGCWRLHLEYSGRVQFPSFVASALPFKYCITPVSAIPSERASEILATL